MLQIAQGRQVCGGWINAPFDTPFMLDVPIDFNFFKARCRFQIRIGHVVDAEKDMAYAWGPGTLAV